MNEADSLRNRVGELEAEIVTHRRAAMLIFLEYANRRPAERPHIIALLHELVPLMGPAAASVSKLLIQELESADSACTPSLHASARKT